MPQYLVRFSQRYFFVRKEAESDTAQATPFLSAATQFSYRAALEVTERLHAMGYTDSVVTNLRGQPLTVDNIDEPDSYNPAEVAWFWAEV